MSKQLDEFEAVRQVVALLESFEETEKERILRWAREKLGMVQQPSASSPQVSLSVPTPSVAASGVGSDLKSFIDIKNPKNDIQLAAVAAYFHRFLAPPAQRKETMNATDLLEACRQSYRKRPARPAQTMVNAYTAGFFDKAGTGSYKLNAVGENLVAMVLPGSDGGGGSAKAVVRGRRRKAKASLRRSVPKRARNRR